MKKIRNVLVFPGGTEIGIEIWRSLKDCKEVRLYSASSVSSCHDRYIFSRNFMVPAVSQPGWATALKRLVIKHRIDYVFPAHDDVIVALAKHPPLPAQLITSPLETCLIARSKTNTHSALEGAVPLPRLYRRMSEVKGFPVFIKPDRGQGSKDAIKIPNRELLKALWHKNSGLAVFECLEGDEYTVDCFTDSRKGLMFCGGRNRIRVRNGISVNSRTVEPKMNEIFRGYAEAIGSRLRFRGAWFFQVKADSKGVLKLLEVAPRIGGAMATHRVMGINFPLLSIFEREGKSIDLLLNPGHIEIDRALVNRYASAVRFEKIYVDLDDTLIVNGRLNLELVALLFQAVQKYCKIILLTKSAVPVNRVLRRWRLDGIFDRVVRMRKNQCKADYIDPKGAIFIDDSFRERKEVSLRHGIATFDSSMIESLRDWRV